jgi:hypothetical protein
MEELKHAIHVKEIQEGESLLHGVSEWVSEWMGEWVGG